MLNPAVYDPVTVTVPRSEMLDSAFRAVCRSAADALYAIGLVVLPPAVTVYVPPVGLLPLGAPLSLVTAFCVSGPPLADEILRADWRGHRALLVWVQALFHD